MTEAFFMTDLEGNLQIIEPYNTIVVLRKDRKRLAELIGSLDDFVYNTEKGFINYTERMAIAIERFANNGSNSNNEVKRSNGVEEN